jgi:hypothetical protein
MVKSVIRTIIAVFIVGLSLLFQTCGEDTLNAPQDFVSGTITYIDNQFTFNGGYYAISIYGDSTNPFTHRPVRTDSIAVNTTGLTAYYKVTGLPSGSYYIGSTWYRKSDGNITVLGSYGCNENPFCPTPTKIEVPSYSGTGQLDFRSKTH